MNRHCFGPSAPERVDDGLNVLLVNDEKVGVDTVRRHAGWSIVECHRNRRPRDRCQTNPARLAGKLWSQVGLLVAAGGQPIDLLPQVRHMVSQFGVVTRLGLNEADQIGVPSGS